MIISFAWTTPAVVIRQKCATRRDWSDKTISQFEGACLTGALVDAWDKSPRFGGKCFGQVKIIEVITKEDSRAIRDSAWREEGFHILTLLGCTIGKFSPADVWEFWKTENEQDQTVVRFELVSLNEYGEELRAKTYDDLAAIDYDADYVEDAG